MPQLARIFWVCSACSSAVEQIRGGAEPICCSRCGPEILSHHPLEKHYLLPQAWLEETMVERKED